MIFPEESDDTLSAGTRTKKMASLYNHFRSDNSL